MTHLKVHDAGHRIRTIRGGCAVFQNFDALNSGLRNRIQIDKHHIDQAGVVARRIGSDSASIEKDESGPGIETVERNCRRTHSGVGAVFIIRNRNDVRVHDRQAEEKLLGGNIT